MFSTIFILLASVSILLLPVAFWMYVFISFFPYGVSRKQFFIGMFSGAVITLPFIYKDGFFSGNILRDTFFHLSVIGDAPSSELSLFSSLMLFFGLLSGVVFLLSYFFQTSKKRFTYSFGIFFLFLILLVGLGIQGILFFSDLLPHSISGSSVMFGDLLFVSVGGIIGYYIIISFLEEGAKYISSMSLSGREEYFKVFQKYICMAACVALGFSFFENILYAYSYITSSGIQYELISVVFFRSIFSIILHLISSMLFAFGFWFVMNFKSKHMQHIISFFLLAGLGIISHVFFDSFLTFGYVGYIFFYIVAIYFFLSYLSVTVPNE